MGYDNPVLYHEPGGSVMGHAQGWTRRRDEPWRIGPLLRRGFYCTVTCCHKSTLIVLHPPNSATVVLPPLIVRDEDKSSVMGLSRFITFSISSFLSMDPILTITSQVPN